MAFFALVLRWSVIASGSVVRSAANIFRTLQPALCTGAHICRSASLRVSHNAGSGAGTGTLKTMARELDTEALLGSLAVWREGGRSLSDLFVEAGVDLIGDRDLMQAVRLVLADRPDFVDLWQGYSWDKRWSPSPYLDGLEVGHYDAGSRHVRVHTDTVEACADFVLTEVRWVVERRVVEGPPPVP